jgi:hypothetical protein
VAGGQPLLRVGSAAGQQHEGQRVCAHHRVGVFEVVDDPGPPAGGAGLSVTLIALLAPGVAEVVVAVSLPEPWLVVVQEG